MGAQSISFFSPSSKQALAFIPLARCGSVPETCTASISWKRVCWRQVSRPKYHNMSGNALKQCQCQCHCISVSLSLSLSLSIFPSLIWNFAPSLSLSFYLSLCITDDPSNMRQHLQYEQFCLARSKFQIGPLDGYG